jgi:hypothetical protein
MQTSRSIVLIRVLTVVATLLVWKVTASVVIEYRNYLPPNFDSTFLLGRQAYFYGPYQWAFYVHLVSGPLSLILGTVLVSNRFRSFAPKWHRRLGRVQGMCILLLVAPSGLWMSYYADTGAVAGIGLGLLAVVTAACVALGWRAAVKRQFASHGRWMWRTFILLCSAVVIRMIGGAAMMAGIDPPWLYPLSVWTSWLVPLMILEIVRTRAPRVPRSSAVPGFALGSATANQTT